ncbi:MAG: hypothetical protein WKF75_19885 [Singulisphaera sp.]
MKRLIRGLLAVSVAAVLLGLGVAWARPRWLPAWARIDFDRLASFVHLGGWPRRNRKRLRAGTTTRNPLLAMFKKRSGWYGWRRRGSPGGSGSRPPR